MAQSEPDGDHFVRLQVNAHAVLRRVIVSGPGLSGDLFDRRQGLRAIELIGDDEGRPALVCRALRIVER